MTSTPYSFVTDNEKPFKSAKHTKKQRPLLNPQANPPVAPPPPPPPPPLDNMNPDSETNDSSKYNNDKSAATINLPSYQNDSRAAPAPTIRHYDDDNDGRAFRGDPTLQPNNGLTNSYDYAIFGLAVHELMAKLRTVNITCSLLVLLLILLQLIFRIIRLQLVKLLLSGILAMLALVLLLVETSSAVRIPQLNALVATNLRYLLHPLWKTLYIVMMVVLCWIIGDFFMYMIGGLFLFSAIVLLAAWFAYPELRRQPIMDDNEDDGSMNVTANEAGSAAWSYYSTSFNAFVKDTSERASLIGNNFLNK